MVNAWGTADIGLHVPAWVTIQRNVHLLQNLQKTKKTCCGASTARGATVISKNGKRPCMRHDILTLGIQENAFAQMLNMARLILYKHPMQNISDQK